MSSMTSSSHLATPSQDKSSAPLQPSNSSVTDPNYSSMKPSSRKPHSLSLSLVHSTPDSSSSIQKTPSNGELRILDSHVPEDDPLSDEEDDAIPCTKANGTQAKCSADVGAQNEPALSTSGASFSTVETAESETSSQSAALFHSGDEHLLNQINRSVSFDRDSLEYCHNSQSEESGDDSEEDTDDGSISTSDQSDEDSDSEGSSYDENASIVTIHTNDDEDPYGLDDHESFSDTHSILSDGYVSAPSFCDEDSPMASSFSPLSEKFMSSTARYSYSDTDNSEPPTPTQPHLNTSLGLPTAQTSGSKIPSDQESDYHSAQSSVQAPTSVSPRKELSIETSGLLQSQETDPSLSTPKNQSSVNITVTQSSPLREHSTNSRSPATLSPFISAMIVSTHTETLDDAEWEKEKKSISVKHIVKPKTKNYTVYRLLVKTADAEYNLDKRYSEMAWLQAKFTKHYPNARLPTFPPKKIFGSSLSNSTIDYRVYKINRWLASVFTIPELIQSPYFFEFFNPPDNHEFVKPFEATPESFAARALSADSLSPPPSNASSLTSSPRLSPGLSPLTPNPIQPVDFSMDTPSLNANSTIFPSLPPSAVSPGSPTKKKKGLSKVAYKTGKMLKRSITGGSGDKLLVDINDSTISKPAPLNLNKTVTRGSSTSRSKRKRKHKKKPSEDRRSNSAAAALNTQETKSKDAMALIETSKTHNEDHGFKSDSSTANSLTPLTKKADDEFALQLPLVDSIQKRQAKKKAKKELKKKKMLMEAVNESGELVVAESKVDGKEADTGFPIYDAIQKRQAKRKAKRKLKKLAKEKEKEKELNSNAPPSGQSETAPVDPNSAVSPDSNGPTSRNSPTSTETKKALKRLQKQQQKEFMERIEIERKLAKEQKKRIEKARRKSNGVPDVKRINFADGAGNIFENGKMKDKDKVRLRSPRYEMRIPRLIYTPFLFGLGLGSGKHEKKETENEGEEKNEDEVGLELDLGFAEFADFNGDGPFSGPNDDIRSTGSMTPSASKRSLSNRRPSLTINVQQLTSKSESEIKLPHSPEILDFKSLSIDESLLSPKRLSGGLENLSNEEINEHTIHGSGSKPTPTTPLKELFDFTPPKSSSKLTSHLEKTVEEVELSASPSIITSKQVVSSPEKQATVPTLVPELTSIPPSLTQTEATSTTSAPSTSSSSQPQPPPTSTTPPLTSSPINGLSSDLTPEKEVKDEMVIAGVQRMSKRKAKVCLDDFKLLKVIGKGTFGKVMLARHKTTSKECAIKVISKVMLKSHPNEIKHVMSERNVLRTNIRHPFLIGLQYSFQTPENLYFVLDYVNGGELFFHLQRERRFSEDRVRFYAAEIVSALEYLHTMNIVYRDLKPENILLDKDGHIALTDFGLAKEGISQHGSTTSTFCGTPEYLAPEILRKQSYGFSVDWWCLGTVIYEMLVGLPPFYSTNTSTLFDKILTEKLRFPSHVSFISRKLVAGLLVKLPARRLGSVGDASEVKTHEFFTGVDWNMVIRKEYLPPFKPDVEGVEDLKYIDPVFWEEEVAELKSTNGTSKVGRKGGSIRRKNDDDEAFAGFTFVGELDDVKREVLGDEGEDGEENGIVESNLSGVKEEGASTSGTTGVESGSAVVSNAIN